MSVVETLSVPYVATGTGRAPDHVRRVGAALRRRAGQGERLLVMLDRVCSLQALGAVAVALLVYLWMPKSMADPDIWWHLRDAALQWQAHAWLRQDAMATTAHGAPWMNHEWLAEAPFYLGWTLGGPRGVLLVSMAVTEAVLLLTYLLCWWHTRRVWVSVVFCCLAAADATVSFGPRTLLFGWLCLAVELILLERWTAGRLRERTVLWALPVLFGLWVNLHGSWIIGGVLLLGFLCCNALTRLCATPAAARWGLRPLHHMLVWPRRRDRALWKATGLAGAALLLNPYGWRLPAYPFDMAFKQTLNIASVEEWRSLDFHSPRAKLFLLMLGVLFCVQLLRRTRWALWELFYVAVGVYAACMYSRFLFLAALVVCPLVAKQVAQCLMPAPEAEGVTAGWRGLVHLLLAACAVPLMVARFPTAKAMADVESRAYPQQALPMLRGLQPQGLVFNQYIWGGYLEWHTPAMSLFLDSRADLFERNGRFRDYLDVTQLRHPLETLDSRGVQYVLYQRKAPLVLLLRATGKWRVLYEDATTILLERAAGGGAR